jgi:predicted DNA-binding protein
VSNKTARRSIAMTPEMRELLAQVVSRQPRDVTEADIIREAIRLYVDEQQDIIGSRKHFQKSLQDRVERLEATLAFHLNVILYLVAWLDPDHADERIAEAILAARRDGTALVEQMRAVRELK